MSIWEFTFFSQNTKGYIDFKSLIFAGRAAVRPRGRALFVYFPGSFFWPFIGRFLAGFWPFFKDFPKEITFFKLLYKTFYSHTLRVLDPLISYLDSREQNTLHTRKKNEEDKSTKKEKTIEDED